MYLLRKLITQQYLKHSVKIFQIEKIKTKKIESNKRVTLLLNHLFRTRKKNKIYKLMRKKSISYQLKKILQIHEINKINVLLNLSSLEEIKDSSMKNTYNKHIAQENSDEKN